MDVGRYVVSIALASLAAASACSGSPVTVGSSPGVESNPCYPNGTCNSGLVCLSNLCVRPVASDAGAIDSSADAAAPIDPAVDAAAAAYATAYCDKSLFCLGSFGGLVDAKTCVARYKLWFIDQLTAPGTGWTPPAFTDCANRVASGTCAEWYAGQSCNQRPGTLPPNQPCNHDSQCATFACLVQGDVCGRCTQQAPTGGTCATSDTCRGDNVCVSGICVGYGALGDACGGTQPCGFGLACRGGACAKADGNTPCTLSAQDCQVGFFCSSLSSSTCQRDQHGPPGSTCGFVNGDTSIWRDCFVGTCVLQSQQMTSTCPKLAADGAACDVDTLCTFPAACVGKVCKLPHAATCK